jgi:hypothetical protein
MIRRQARTPELCSFATGEAPPHERHERSVERLGGTRVSLS